jgi:hypothetical protein
MLTSISLLWSALSDAKQHSEFAASKSDDGRKTEMLIRNLNC